MTIMKPWGKKTWKKRDRPKAGCFHPQLPIPWPALLISTHFPLRALRMAFSNGQDPKPEKEPLEQKRQSRAEGQQEERKMNFQGIKANSAT